MIRLSIRWALLVRSVLGVGGVLQSAAAQKTVKVFILAGQSNMEGKGAVNTLDHLGDDPLHGGLLKKIKKPDGSWVERKDVWIWYLGRKGRLTVGYGSDGGPHGALIGPELGFGVVMGDALREPVLLIKTAWGGKDVAKDFLPPGAGGPGPFYTKMRKHLRDVLKNLKTLFPDLPGNKYEIAGFVWFQGWNDMIDADKTAHYTERMAHLIRDLRQELRRPKLPVVIGELGSGGDQAKGGMARFRVAQAAIANLEEFRGNVSFVKTALYYDMKAHELYEQDVWKGPEKEKFYLIASDRPYHYLGSGKTFFLMGHAFGEAMVGLLEK